MALRNQPFDDHDEDAQREFESYEQEVAYLANELERLTQLRIQSLEDQIRDLSEFVVIPRVDTHLSKKGRLALIKLTDSSYRFHEMWIRELCSDTESCVLMNVGKHTLLIDQTSAEIADGRIYVFRLGNGTEASVGILERVKKSQVRIVTYDPDTIERAEKTVKSSSIHVFGEVVWMARRFR